MNKEPEPRRKPEIPEVESGNTTARWSGAVIGNTFMSPKPEQDRETTALHEKAINEHLS